MTKATKRRRVTPPNLAARALAQGQFRPRAKTSAKAYSRKIKFKKGSAADGSLPFAFLVFDPVPPRFLPLN